MARERDWMLGLLRKLRKISPRVIWVGPPELRKAKDALEAFQQMVSGEVPYLDARTTTVSMMSDQLHCARPNPGGCIKWVKWIWDEVKASAPQPEPVQPASLPAASP